MRLSAPGRLSASLGFALVLLVSSASGLHAATLLLSYHDGQAEGAVQDLEAGDAEALRFTIDDPCLIERVRLWPSTDGALEVHVWGDNGGLQPDLTRDLTPPVTVQGTAGEPVEVTFPGEGVRVERPQAFFVGIMHAAAEPALLVDSHETTERRSYIYAYLDEYGERLWFGLDGTYLVEAEITTVDALARRWFTDVTDEAGVAPAGRVAWADYDGDGDPDLCVGGGRLYRNDGDGRFTDVTEAAGIGGFGTNGGVWADYDNDGDIDLYATVSSFESEDPGRHDHLWRNEGDGTFTDVSDAAGAPYDDFPSEAAAWGDYDGDGFVDLYVANYEQPGDTLSLGTPDFLWHNNGDGTFSDASEESGLRAVAVQCGRGVTWADFDQDGDLDIYVSNYRLDPNFLFVNQGDGTFLELAREHGVQGVPVGPSLTAAYGHTIGSAWGDLDGDGDLDLLAANLAHPRFIRFSDKTMLYRNDGGPGWGFTDRRAASGIDYAETHSSPALGDVDNDGDLDVFITSVYEDRVSYLYRNDGRLSFTDVNYPSGAVVTNGWGAAFADYDGDGDLDLATRRLFRNDHDAVLPAGHWLKVRLEGVTSNRSAIGARIVVFAGGRVLVRQVTAGVGTGCQEPLVQHFGLGDAAAIDRLTVRWPTGLSETRQGPIPADQTLDLLEGAVSLGGPSTDSDAGALAEPDAGVVAPGPDVVPEAPDASPSPAPDARSEDTAAVDTGAPGTSSGGGGCAAAGGGAPIPLAAPAILLLLWLALKRRTLAISQARAAVSR